MQAHPFFALPLACVLFAGPQTDLPPAPAALPVREVTVFKDGHAFVVRRGTAPTDANGHVVLDGLPAPVLGTFWPFAADEHARLRSVVAARADAEVARPASDVRALIEANEGADVVVTEGGRSYAARIAGILRPDDAAAPSPSPPREAPAPALALLETAEGVRAVPIERIADVTFRGAFESRLRRTEPRDRLTLQLDWGDAAPGAAAEVGMMYVQKGLRWIPGYKVELDGKGNAVVTLQATLINDLFDLEDVSANLVIGVPRFEFEHTIDPIALEQAAAALSPWFEKASQTAYALSNAIMTQTARMTELHRPVAAPAPSDEDRLGEAAGHEDLFVFTVEHVTLARGARMVVPVARQTLPYEDVFSLDVPMTPPREVWQQFDQQRCSQLAPLFHAPKVEHLVRLHNTGDWPLTTAPALLLRDGRVLAQGMMTYTARGARSDLAVTTAVDIAVEKSETESAREPDAERWRKETYTRIELTGAISLANYGDSAVVIEVKRRVLGNVDQVGDGGVATRMHVLEAPGAAAFGGTGSYPFWWGWWSWPWWWHHFNGITRVDWRVELAPGDHTELDYRWHYFWR